MNLLETTKLVKTYNGRTVVDEVSFVLAQEEIVGLLGRNGAGKTTTFRMILGMVTPDSGAVAFDGTDITHLPMYKRARLGIGYLSQEQSDFRRLTVWQNLMAILETLNISRAERNRRAEQLLDQYGLLKLQEPARLHALRRRAAQAGDRPRAGHRAQADPARRAVQRRRPDRRRRPPGRGRRLREEFGKSVLITDHNVPQTLRVCDRALIINDGRVFTEGTPRQIINDPAVRSAYLGNTFRGDEFDDVAPPPQRGPRVAASPPAVEPPRAAVQMRFAAVTRTYHSSGPSKPLGAFPCRPSIAPASLASLVACRCRIAIALARQSRSSPRPAGQAEVEPTQPSSRRRTPRRR